MLAGSGISVLLLAVGISYVQILRMNFNEVSSEDFRAFPDTQISDIEMTVAETRNHLQKHSANFTNTQVTTVEATFDCSQMCTPYRLIINVVVKPDFKLPGESPFATNEYWFTYEDERVTTGTRGTGFNDVKCDGWETVEITLQEAIDISLQEGNDVLEDGPSSLSLSWHCSTHTWRVGVFTETDGIRFSIDDTSGEINY